MRFVARGVSLLVVMAGVTFGAGCKTDKPTPPVGSEPKMLKLRPDAPALEQTSASFYAKNGEAREVALHFKDSVGGRGSVYVRLRMGPNTLLARPDGTPIAPGDSVLIEVKIPEPGAVLFELEPSGLRFNAAQPAELMISYAEANQDFDGDGNREKDQDDQAIERRLGIWRQEVRGGPFTQLKSRVDEQLDQVTAPLEGFTRYAISY